MKDRLEKLFLEANKRIWERLPTRALDLHATRVCGAWLNDLIRRRAGREMYLGSLFLRNRPALELLRRLMAKQPHGSTVRIAVLGCSIGAEVYSLQWALLPTRPDLSFVVYGVDISEEVLAIAERGIYGPQTSEVVRSSIFDRLTETELAEMFDWEGDQGRVRHWLREGIMWRVGDASDPRLIDGLGPQDLVVASNFLCHMEAPHAEWCLRNLAQLAKPGGYLFVSGVDLDVRAKVALDLGWEPVLELVAEIHDGDPLVRADWPWQWWGLEPLDSSRHDWRTRYASVFRVGMQATGESPAVRQESTRESPLETFA